LTPDTERGTHSRSALARLIAESETDFSADFWGAKPLLSRAADLPGDLSDLFSLEAVDELVSSRAIRTPFVRMANEGTLLDASRYTSSGGFGAEISDQLDSAKVLREFAAGATLVLQGLHRTWRPIADFTRQLVADVGHPAQVNAYVTPASSRGFDPHYDVHDVFVIQIAGEKHWVIHEPVHADPLRNQPWSDHAQAVAERAKGAPAIDATFAPGDVLYLPRGWIHSATALGGTSVHLTIGVAAITRWDVVQQLVSTLAADPALRASLPMSVDLSDSSTIEAILQQTVVEVVRSLGAGVDADKVGTSLGRVLVSAGSAEPLSPMASIEALGSLGSASVVSWRKGLAARIERNEVNVSVVLADRTITLPVEAAAALEMLVAGTASRVSELPLDEASAIVVTRRLVREGVLVLR
jgi:lysine-specific demethylase/histidyl-hydroxylase NO66